MAAVSIKLQPEGFYSIEVTTPKGCNIVALADTKGEAEDKVQWLMKKGRLSLIQNVAND